MLVLRSQAIQYDLIIDRLIAELYQFHYYLQ